MPRQSREFYGGNVKPWGNLCELCPENLRRLTVGCESTGCELFESTVDRNRGNRIFYRMNCPKCKQWTAVKPPMGMICSLCGLDCRYASQAHAAKDPGHKVSTLLGPIMDEVEDLEDEEGE